MKMKDVEYGLKVETGFINDESKFYTGFCAALNTNNGHVLMIATTVKELEIQSKLVINSDFELNDDMVSRVGLCKEKHITKTECKESKEMNEHILLVMKYLDDKNSVSKQELKENANAANAAAYAAAYADAVAYADAAADAAAANAAASAVADAVADAVAEKWINRYFDHTKEDKQTYIDAINAGKESKEMKSDRLAGEIMEKSKESVYTREMFDNGEVPHIGMMFICKEKTFDSRISDFLNKVVEVIGVSILNGDEVITFSHEIMGIGCGRFGEEWVKPIDTRTDSQKAVDAIKDVLEAHYENNGFNTAEIDCTGDAECVFSAINSDMICGVSFTGDKK
jgi:hypothetical protein